MAKILFFATVALAVLACVTSQDVKPLDAAGPGDVPNCAKAPAAMRVVCEAYGHKSDICTMAKDHYSRACRLGDGGDGAGSASAKDGLKEMMTPILEQCQRDYEAAKSQCRVKVALTYRYYKSQSKKPKTVKAAPKVVKVAAKPKGSGSGKSALEKKAQEPHTSPSKSSEELADSIYLSPVLLLLNQA